MIIDIVYWKKKRKTELQTNNIQIFLPIHYIECQQKISHRVSLCLPQQIQWDIPNKFKKKKYQAPIRSISDPARAASLMAMSLVELSNPVMRAFSDLEKIRVVSEVLFVLWCMKGRSKMIHVEIRINIHVITWVGKCPNWTSPNYWGYNHQQILESDVQNPPNRTFTNPCIICYIIILWQLDFAMSNLSGRLKVSQRPRFRRAHRFDPQI